MIKCIAIDDEPLALKQMCSYIEKIEFLTLESKFESAVDALDFLKNNKTDLMFVDINMPDITGIELVKMLDNCPMIVFTTAYNQYAIEGFKVDAIDYLLKPITFSDFLKAANKAKDWFEVKNKKENTEIKANKDFLFIKSEYQIIRINFKNIIYIEGMREYVRIHLDNQKPVMTLLSMKAIESHLSNDSFMRIHRSFIVNLNKIFRIERLRIIFDEKTIIPIGEQYKDKFQKYLDDNFLI